MSFILHLVPHYGHFLRPVIVERKSIVLDNKAFLLQSDHMFRCMAIVKNLIIINADIQLNSFNMGISEYAYSEYICI